MDYVVSLSSLYAVILELQIRVIEEPECCDGSDEPSGLCPNICKEVGDTYSKKVAEERKIRKTVGALFPGHLQAKRGVVGRKNTIYLYYICPQRKEEVGGLDCVVGEGSYCSGERGNAVKRYVHNTPGVDGSSSSIDVMDRTESLSEAALEFKKQSRESSAECAS